MEIFFGKIFRAILMLLDDAVYGLAEMVYRLFIKIAETGIFSQGSIQEFAGRIYFFLGLAMLFKVSISIIDYIMNPDSVKDNKVGASKLLKNIVTILVGIVAIPYVFEAAYGLQRIILKDNVIGNLILGVKYTDNESDAKSYTEKAGDEMSFAIYNAFFHVNEELVDSTCQNGAWEGEDGVFKDDCFPSGDLESVKSKYIEAYNSKQRQELTKFEIMNATTKAYGDEEFVFSYMYVVATAAGAFLCYILLLFCFDIAVRSVKLGFLQLIAPIPLISKIDPKKGDEVFNKWVKEVTSTYLLLFIRLVAIYFAIYIVSSLTDSGHTDEKNLFVNVFMIFGVLLFVKDLPKLIETLTGVKLDGTLSLNKRMREVPLVGNRVADAAGFVGRTARNLGLGGVAAAGHGLGKIGEKIRNTEFGQSVAEGYNYSGLKTKLLDPASARLKKFSQGAGERFREVDNLTGNRLSRIGTDFQGSVGAGFTKTRDDKLLAAHKKANDVITNMENRARDKIKNGEAGRLSREYLSKQSAIDNLKNFTNEERAEFNRLNDINIDDYIAQQEMDLGKWLNTKAIYEYQDSNGKDASIFDTDENGNVKSDAAMADMYSTYSSIVSASGFDNYSSAKERHAQQGEFKSEDTRINNSRAAQQEAKSNK